MRHYLTACFSIKKEHFKKSRIEENISKMNHYLCLEKESRQYLVDFPYWQDRAAVDLVLEQMMQILSAATFVSVWGLSA